MVSGKTDQAHNYMRPHEALGDETPGSRWKPSRRPFPKRIAPPEYPGHCEIRRVSNSGMIRMGKEAIFISHALETEYVALEEVDDGLWNILFYKTLLGRYDEREGLVTGADFRNLKG